MTEDNLDKEVIRDEEIAFMPKDDDGGTTQEAAKEAPQESQAERPQQTQEDLLKIKTELDNIKRALSEERLKRQEAQRLLEYYEFQAKLQARQAEQQPKKEEDPDIEALKPLVAPIIEEKISPLTVEARTTKALLSEERARARYKDYDELVYQNIKTPDGTERPFLEVIVKDPTYSQLFYNSPDPAEFAYRMAMFLNWDKYLEKAREDGRNEVLAKLQKSSQAPASLSKEGASARHGEADLTLEQAARLSPQAWAALPEKTRRRLLGLA